MPARRQQPQRPDAAAHCRSRQGEHQWWPATAGHAGQGAGAAHARCGGRKQQQERGSRAEKQLHEQALRAHMCTHQPSADRAPACCWCAIARAELQSSGHASMLWMLRCLRSWQSSAWHSSSAAAQPTRCAQACALLAGLHATCAGRATGPSPATLLVLLFVSCVRQQGITHAAVPLALRAPVLPPPGAHACRPGARTALPLHHGRVC